MQTEVLRVLRAEARSWWRHRELRKTGDLNEALRLERQTIRCDIGYLRAALNNPNAYVSCGGGSPRVSVPEIIPRVQCRPNRGLDVVELIVLARALGTDTAGLLAATEAATEPDHRI